MWKKIAIGGCVAAAIVGVGTAALATSDTPSTTSGTPTSSSAGSSSSARLGPVRRALRAKAVLHGTVVTKNPKTGDVVTHDVSHGTVSAVSATSITVQPADGTTQTYVVGPATKVRQRSDGKGSSSSIGAVHDGDQVYVVGTGTSTVTATAIVDVK
jgi:hypothetical protein